MNHTIQQSRSVGAAVWAAFILIALLPHFMFGAERPNVVVIITDDQGWADIGYNNPRVYTPNLDELANSGAKFTNHYVMPQCTPTRVALMTGRYPGRFSNEALAASNLPVFPLGTPTLPGMFQDNGYDTFMSGKWHLGSTPEHGPNHFGFDESHGSLTGAVGMYDHRYHANSHPLYDPTWHRNHEIIPGYQNGRHVTDLTSEEAVRFIREERSEPFFLYLPFHAPHTPLDERGQFVDTPTQPDIDNPDRWLNEDRIEWFNDPAGKIQAEESRDKRLLLATVHHLDSAIGEVVRALEETGQRENTIIFFSSDNGPYVNSGGGGYPDNYPLEDYNQPDHLRGKKLDVWEGGILVPGFVNWPGRITPQEIDEPVHIIDWFPTLAGITGIRPEPRVAWDGLDLGPLLFGNGTLPDRDLYWIWASPVNRRALRHNDWKIVFYHQNEPKLDHWALFNLAQDPGETRNVADDHPNLVREMHERYLIQRSKDISGFTAAVTYVDAVEGAFGNTFMTGSTPGDTSWFDPDSTTDWRKRAFANESTIFEGDSQSGSPPELTTQIPGLADGTYAIWAFYWDQVESDTSDWVLSAGLTSGSLTTYSSPGEPAVSGATTAGVTNAASLDFTNSVMVSDSPRAMFGINLGKVDVSGGSTVDVFLGNNIAAASPDNRAWYDGVGYSPVSAIPSLVGKSPPDGATGIPLETDIVATFDEAVAAGTGSITLRKTDGGATVASFDVAGSSGITFAGSSVTLTPPDDLDPAENYHVLIDATAIVDESGNAFPGISSPTEWDLTTLDPGVVALNAGMRLFGVEFNRNDHFSSPSQSNFRIIAGSATQSANATHYSKTIGAFGVTVSQPDGTQFEFRGANGDGNRDIPGGDTSLSFLVSDFIATREGAIDIEITGLAAGDYVFQSWHLEPFIGSAFGFAQGATTTSPNTIEARIGGEVQDSTQPTALGPAGLDTTFIDDNQIPDLAFVFTHDGSTPLIIELRSTQSNGSSNFLLLNGFQLFETIL